MRGGGAQESKPKTSKYPAYRSEDPTYEIDKPPGIQLPYNNNLDMRLLLVRLATLVFAYANKDTLIISQLLRNGWDRTELPPIFAAGLKCLVTQLTCLLNRLLVDWTWWEQYLRQIVHTSWLAHDDNIVWLFKMVQCRRVVIACCFPMYSTGRMLPLH